MLPKFLEGKRYPTINDLAYYIYGLHYHYFDSGPNDIEQNKIEINFDYNSD